MYGIPLILLALAPLLPSYYTFLIGGCLVMGIFALSFNLLLNYAGLLSFGQAAYFGLGTYTVALLMRYHITNSMEVMLLITIVATAIYSAAIGYVCVRYTRLYFAMLTLAFGQMLYSLILKAHEYTRGTDGLSVPHPALLTFDFEGVRTATFLNNFYYPYILVFFVISLILMRVITSSHFGKVLLATKASDVRTEFLGVPVKRYRWYIYIISAIFASLAGALAAPLYGHVAPTFVNWTFSGEVIFMSLLGGYGVFIGPVIGAFLFVFLKTYAIALTMYWQLILGAILVALVLAFPGGISGWLNAWYQKRRRPALGSVPLIQDVFGKRRNE